LNEKRQNKNLNNNSPVISSEKYMIRGNKFINNLQEQDHSVHDWYRFVLSFPPYLVRDYLSKFNIDKSKRVLDPFCGTGTTLVECKKNGIPSIGIDANPIAFFASKVKTDWSIDPNELWRHATEVAQTTLKKFENQGLSDNGDLPLFGKNIKSHLNYKKLPAEAEKIILRNSISPLPLHKTLELLDTLRIYRNEKVYQHEMLALAKAIVFKISNLHFGPEVGVRSPKRDAPVVSAWLSCVREIADDLKQCLNNSRISAEVHFSDSRDLNGLLELKSIDTVITSPPYPNEKDYTRTTRLESVLLGFINDRKELRSLKMNLVRSNTRGVYKNDADDLLVEDHEEINRIANAIENRRVELGKTSGFERLYPRVAKLYFGGMFRHFSELRKVLKPGAHLAYVVGDQASYLRIMIRTGQILADIAKSLGYKVVSIDLFRTRLATATRKQLREEVVVLYWPG
jgi:DNA modification methylase